MFCCDFRHGGNLWHLWCVRLQHLSLLGRPPAWAFGESGGSGSPQEKDQILLHEPLWEIPRSWKKTMEAPATDRQDWYHYHPSTWAGTVRMDLFYVSIVILNHFFVCFLVGVFWTEQPNGCGVQRRKPDDVQTPLSERLRWCRQRDVRYLQTGRCLWPHRVHNHTGEGFLLCICGWKKIIFYDNVTL